MRGVAGPCRAKGSPRARAPTLHPSHPVNAVFNGYTVCVHPAFRTGEISAKSDPFGGYSGGEDEMLAYLKANPQLAKQAGSAAVSIAQHNPEVSQGETGLWRDLPVGPGHSSRLTSPSTRPIHPAPLQLAMKVATASAGGGTGAAASNPWGGR